MAKYLAVDSTSLVIANGATTSTAITLPSNKRLMAIQTPSALTGTTFTFESSSNGGTTYVPVYNESTAYSVTVSTSRHIRLNGEVFDGCAVVRIVSGSAEGASRTIIALIGEA